MYKGLAVLDKPALLTVQELVVRQSLKRASLWFRTWRVWQQHVFVCRVMEHCSRRQLHILATALELYFTSISPAPYIPNTMFVYFPTPHYTQDLCPKAFSFSISCVQVSFVLGWIPGVSVAVLENVVAIPHDLAVLCATPLRIFAFFCFTGKNIVHLIG